MKLKKGSIQISFSWIFMIIIGTFFIILAYNIIAKYQHNEQEIYEYELSQALREILNNVGRTTGIEENKIEPLQNIFKDTKIEILCNNNIPILWINDGDISDDNNQFLKNYPSFMTYIEEGKVPFTYLAIENYRLPFKITNLLAIVSRKNLIVLDKNSKVSEELLKKFNEGSYSNLNFQIEDFTIIDYDIFWDKYKDLNLNSIIFVSDNSVNLADPTLLSKLNPISYHVKINQENGYGDITYINQKGEASNKYNYVDYDKSLSIPTMAVFSKPETFDCSYNLIFDNINAAYTFYENKTNYLIKMSENTNKTCSSGVLGSESKLLYQNFLISIQETKELIKTERFNNSKNIYSNILKVEAAAKELEKYNCLYVY